MQSVAELIQTIEQDEHIEKANREKLLEYIRSKTISDWQKYTTIISAIITLKNFGEFCKKPFKDLEAKDIDLWAHSISQWRPRVKPNEKQEVKPIAKATLMLKLTQVKTFLIWLNDGDKPKCMKHIKIDLQNCMRDIKDSDLITDEEFRKVYGQARDLQTKCMLSILYETPLRAGELIINLKVSDVTFDQFGARLMLFGKTGHRKVRVINSAPLLRQHLELLPNKDQEDAPLFLNARGRPMQYISFQYILKKLLAKTDIPQQKKKVMQRIHYWRHSRLTRLARQSGNYCISEFALKELAGWQLGSNMARRYLHGVESDEAILRMHGLKKDDSVLENKQAPVKCLNCETLNAFDNLFCSNSKCNKPISAKGFKAFQDGKQEVRELLKETALASMDKTKLKEQIRQLFKEEPNLVSEALGELPMAVVLRQFVKVNDKVIEEQ